MPVQLNVFLKGINVNAEIVDDVDASDLGDSLEDGTSSAQELEIMRVFADRLNELLIRNGFPKPLQTRYTRISEEFAVSVSGARKWCLGKAIPSPAVLVRLAKRFGTSTDYLLGLQNTLTPTGCQFQRPITVPIYSFGDDKPIRPPKVDHKRGQERLSGGVFQKIKEICFERDEGDPEFSFRFFVESWVDMRNPTLHKGDLLLIDPSENHLQENGTYLIATKTMICVRRIIAHIDGRAELIGEYADKQDSSCVTPDEISFNVSRSPEEPLPTRGIKVLGRVIAKIIKLDNRIRGLM